MARIKRDEKTVKIAEEILKAYQPQNIEEMQDALKDVFGPMIETTDDNT